MPEKVASRLPTRLNESYILESCPEGLWAASIRSAVKETFVINRANLHKLNNSVRESDAKFFPDVCVENLYDFLGRHFAWSTISATQQVMKNRFSAGHKKHGL
jgi:hypothetical protein